MRRLRLLSLLLPAALSIFAPISDGVAGAEKILPGGAGILDSLGIATVEEKHHPLEGRHGARASTIDQETHIGAVGIVVRLGDPHRLEIGVAVADSAVRQKGLL